MYVIILLVTYAKDADLVLAHENLVKSLKIHTMNNMNPRGQDTSLCMTPRGLAESCTVRYSGSGQLEGHGHVDTEHVAQMLCSQLPGVVDDVAKY